MRDIFLTAHPDITEREFEVLLQLHANQPFSIDDVHYATAKKKDWNDDYTNKTGLGIRLVKKFMRKMLRRGSFTIFKKNGPHNKKLYLLSSTLNTELRRMYEYMLCLSKIRINDPSYTPQVLKNSPVHYRKMLKQNRYKDAFDAELKRKIETTDGEFNLTLQQVRAETRNF